MDPKGGTCPRVLCSISILSLPALRLLESMSSMGNQSKRISKLEKIKTLCVQLFWALLVRRRQQALREWGSEGLGVCCIQSARPDLPANPEKALHYLSEEKSQGP